MSDWQSGTITTNGINLHYTRIGGDKPPFVLSHGVTDDGLCWTPIAREFEKDYDVIMLDARGHGLSDAPQAGFGPLDQAADLAGVIRGLGLEKPLLLGHSMGAVTTLVLAGLHPELPRAILLEDPPDWWMPEKQATPMDAERQKMIVQWMTDLQSKSRKQIIADQRKAAPRWSEAELAPWADSKLRFHPQVLRIFGPNPAAGVDWKSLLTKITCPVLLITADPALGSIVSAESAKALQALLPQVKLAHLPGAGHNIRREQFEPYLAAVRTFLAELPG